MTAEGKQRALDNAQRVVDAERLLGIHLEPEFQRPMLRYPGALHAMGAAYAGANVGLTISWLIVMFAQRNPEFHRMRRATVIATMAAQPFFLLFPCEPPRKLGHIVDTIADVSGVDLESGLIGRLYIPIAAMPSIHVTYAVVTGYGLAATSESRLVRAAGKLYAPLVAWIVFVTGNHYVLDAVLGGVIGGLALRVARWCSRS